MRQTEISGTIFNGNQTSTPMSSVMTKLEWEICPYSIGSIAANSNLMRVLLLWNRSLEVLVTSFWTTDFNEAYRSYSGVTKTWCRNRGSLSPMAAANAELSGVSTRWKLGKFTAVLCGVLEQLWWNCNSIIGRITPF
jgi:hypothetical protein